MVRLSVARICCIVGCLYFILLSHVYWKKGETEHEIRFSSMAAVLKQTSDKTTVENMS